MTESHSHRYVASAIGAGVAIVAIVYFLGASGSEGSSQAAARQPTANLTIDDLTYRGAFRLSSDTFGESTTNYAVGTLAFNPANNSLFIAGHAQHNAVAEFAIPAALGMADLVEELPIVESPTQEFTEFLNDAPTGNPDGIDRIDGMYVDAGRLIVNAERWYDAAGSANDTTLVLDADNLGGPVRGYHQLAGGVHAAGYMSAVPPEWRAALGGPVLTGWASNTSIISRHSIGPTLFTFDSADLFAGDATVDPSVDTDVHMNFPYAGQRWMAPDALDTAPGSASPLWNHLSKARFGFIAPGTSTFVVIGSTGGVESGIGYKITQNDGNLCGGYCAYDAADSSNAYWLFDVNEILAADDVHLPRPFAYGPWSVPFDSDGQHSIIGGTFDPATSTLYVALGGAGKVATYDQPPLIVVYGVPQATSSVVSRIDAPARVNARAERLG